MKMSYILRKQSITVSHSYGNNKFVCRNYK